MPVVNHVLEQANSGHPLLQDKFPFKVQVWSFLTKPGEAITKNTPRKKKEMFVTAVGVDPDDPAKKRMELMVGVRKDEILELRFKNFYGQDVAATVLVDGINTLGQKRDRLGKAWSWVLPQCKKESESYTVEGWYIPKKPDAQPGNDEDFILKRFQIGTPAQSVAARLGFEESIGLITAAFYAEKGRSVAFTEGPEEERQLQAVNFTPGRLLAIVHIRYVDENHARLRKK